MSESAADFNHTRSDLDEVTAEFSISVPQSEFSKRIDAEVSKLAPQVVVKGFRKGKAPAAMVKKLHGDRVRGEVAQRLVSETLYQALEKEKIEETVGEPELNIESLEEDKDFSYKAKVFFPPKPKIEGYDKFTVEIEESEVGDDAVDKSVDELRSSQATVKAVTDRDEVQSGDIISGKIVVTVDGEEPGGEEPLVVKIGDGQVPEELESGVLGMKVGESKDISAEVPDTHQDESLRGKGVVYAVTVDQIQEQELPELTDDFVKTLGYGAETVLELRLKVRERLEEQQKGAESTEVHSQIIKQLLEKNAFVIPQNMIDAEIRGLLVQNGFLDPQKVDVGRISVEPFRESFGAMAEERVKVSIVIEQIAEQEKIEFSDEDAKQAAAELGEQHGIPFEDVEKLLLAPGRKENFIREHRQKKALDLLQERAKIKKVKKKSESKEESKKKE